MPNYDHHPVHSSPSSGVYVATLPVTGSGANAAGAATKYLTAAGQNHSASEVPLHVVGYGGTKVHTLYVSLVTAPGGSDTYIATVMKSSDNGATWSATALTCTITGAAKANNDVTNTATVAAGDLLAIRVVSSAGTAAGGTATFLVS